MTEDERKRAAKDAIKALLAEMIRDGEVGVNVSFEQRGGDYYESGRYGCCVYLTVDGEPVIKAKDFEDEPDKDVDSFDYLPSARF